MRGQNSHLLMRVNLNTGDYLTPIIIAIAPDRGPGKPISTKAFSSCHKANQKIPAKPTPVLLAAIYQPWYKTPE